MTAKIRITQSRYRELQVAAVQGAKNPAIIQAIQFLQQHLHHKVLGVLADSTFAVRIAKFGKLYGQEKLDELITPLTEAHIVLTAWLLRKRSLILSYYRRRPYLVRNVIREDAETKLFDAAYGFMFNCKMEIGCPEQYLSTSLALKTRSLLTVRDRKVYGLHHDGTRNLNLDTTEFGDCPFDVEAPKDLDSAIIAHTGGKYKTVEDFEFNATQKEREELKVSLLQALGSGYLDI